MKSRVFALFILALAVGLMPGKAQKNAKPSNHPKEKVIYYVPHMKNATPETMASISKQGASGQTIPLWTYSTVAQDGKTYTGSMVGRSPFNHGHRATTIPTYIVPVILTFADVGDVFDPTQPDSCAPNGDSVMNLILNSPLFLQANFTMNGVNVGLAQYVDGFQRASFWSKVGGTPYHTAFSTSPTVLPAVRVTVPAADGISTAGTCHDFGKMNFDWWDNQLQKTILPSLAAQGVGPANFPQFVFNSVVEFFNGDPNQCCALGYHSSFMNSGVFQTYSVNEYDSSQSFSGDTSTMSHEIAEWLDDPATNNQVPSWGAEGQVTAGSCQGNLEVGDPLSPNYPTPTNPFSLTNNSTGVTYTLQELAFYSWFLGSSPSLGAGGGYSNNGTFKGFAKACPAGGTN